MSNSTQNITQTGHMNWSALQKENAAPFKLGSLEDIYESLAKEGKMSDVAARNMMFLEDAQVSDSQVRSPILESSRGKDYWGNSFFDNDIADESDWAKLGDIRAEGQPWYSKIANGLAKAGVTAVTTALETGGLVYGIGQGIYDAANAEDGKGWQAFGKGLWYNPITRGLQKLNEYAEEYMPNYYTQDEQENPWGHIFSANFLGDKLIKNFGFMVGAFYGGIPLAKGVGALGKAAVRSARTANLAERAGMAERVAQLTSGYSDDVIREAGEYGRLLERSGEAAVDASRFSDEAKGLHKLLSANNLTEAERGRKIVEGLNSIKDIAKVTRGTSQVLGSLGSALNEGAIEAINNSKDWADLERQKALDEYQQKLQNIELTVLPSERDAAKIAARKAYEDKLALIEEGRAKVGNADLLWNLPILMVSNMFELGKLYTRGFDSSRRMMGTFWNGYKLEGSLKKGTLASGRTRTGAILSGLMNSNMEGMEEFLQKAAADGAGQAVSEAIARHISLGKTDASKLEVDNYLAGMAKAIATNLHDPKAWEEYFIGAVSAMFGMPVFGSQTKNAWTGNNGVIGLAGGMVGEYNDYMDAKRHEEKIAQHLNEIATNPNSKSRILYKHLREYNDYDELLRDALLEDDKRKYKDLAFEQMFKDINAAASAGHLEEFKQLIGYDSEYTDQDLDDIVKNTTTVITKEQQQENDKKRAVVLENAIAVAEDNDEDAKAEDYRKELEEVQERLDHPENYKEIKEGPFITRDGLPMNTADKEGMIEILDRNREYQLQMIDNYVKIRNDIDIETDGALKDDQIELLTMMRGKILDYDKRSAEIAYDLVSTLDDTGIRTRLDNVVNDLTAAVEKAQAAYDKAVEGKKDEASKKLAEAKVELHNAEERKKLYDAMISKVEATRSEMAATAKGRGEGLLSRTLYRLGFNPRYKGERYRNTDELDSYVHDNVRILFDIIEDSGLALRTRQRLLKELADLFILAHDKFAYNAKIREFLGDPTKINDAYKREEDKITKEEMDKRTDELASRIRKVSSMLDLDGIMREALQSNPRIANAALDQAEKDGSEGIKKLIADYRKAVNFRNAFHEQALKIEDPAGIGIQEGVINTLNSAWENALAYHSESFHDMFVSNMKEAAENLSKEESTASKAVGKAISDILADIKDAERVTTTHKDTKEPEDTGKKDDSEKEKSLAERMAAAAAESEERTPAKDKPEESKPLKRGDILDAIRKEVSDENFESLSSKLKKAISKFNEDNPDDRIEEKDIADILDSITDERIKSNLLNTLANDNASKQNSGQEAGVENRRDNDRSDKMKGILSSTYKSDYITYYDFKEGKVQRVKYNVSEDAADRERLVAIQQMLKDYKAYDFVDTNLLGYIYRYFIERSLQLDVHFLRSTDAKVDDNTASADAEGAGTTSPLFLAIEITGDTEAALKKYLGKHRDLSNVSRQVDVNEGGVVKHYQIIGVAAVDKSVPSELKDAFRSLQTSIYKETHDAVEDARKTGAPFVASSKTTYINEIFTGRLEVQNDEDDLEDNITSLYQLMTTGGKSTDESAGERHISLEWKNPETSFHFGVVVNTEIHTDIDRDDTDHINPNENWCRKEGNNGAILLYVPRPDGVLYPLRCRRRSVKDWLKKTDNVAGMSGEDFIKAILAGERSNDYLQTIIGYIKDLLDSDSSDGKRMKAKEKLHRYLTLGSDSPIHFSGNLIKVYNHNMMITDDMSVPEDTPGNTSEEKALNYLVQQFFSILAEQDGVMFNIPSPTIEPVNGRSVIESGVFDARLRGFYNFNASFTVVPIDGDGKVVSAATPVETIPSEPDIKPNEYEIEINGASGKYRIDGSTITIDGRPATPEEQQAVGFYQKVFDGTASPYKTQVLRDDMLYKDMHNDIFSMVSDGIGFDNVYIDESGEWICIKKDGSDKTQVFRRDSDKGKALEKSILDEARKWSDKHEAEIVKKTKEILGKDEEKSEDKPEDTNLAEAERLAGIEQKAYEDALKDRAGDSKENLLSVRNTFQRTLDNGGNTDELAATYIGIIRAIDELLAKMPKDYVKPDELIGATGARFSGTLDEVLVQKETDRIRSFIAPYKSKPIAKTVWGWLQDAEARGKAIDDAEVLKYLNAIFKGKKDEKDVAKGQLCDYLGCKP